MFEAGAIAFNLQMVGAQVFQNEGKAADQVVKKLGETAEQSAPKLKKTGEAVDGVGKAAKAAKAPLDDTAKSTGKVGDESSKAEPKVKKVTKSVEQLRAESNAARTTVGTAFLGIGAAVGAMAGIAIAKFSDFDQGLSNLKATTHANAQEQRDLGNAAIEAGARTTFSARESVDAQNELAKAGLSVHDILKGGLNGSLALAAAGELGVARAGEIAATTLQQFQLEGNKAGHVADVLAAGANKAIGSVDDLANGLKFVGPIAHGMNISLEETVGTLALFAASGVVGEQGGTALRGMLSSLTSPSAEARKEIARLGIELYDTSGNFLGLENTAGQLQKAYSGLSGEQTDMSLGLIFGNQQITAARLLYQAGAKGVDEYTKAVNDSGYAAEVAATKQDNLAGDVEKLGGSLDSAFVKTGGSANEVLRDLVQTVTGLTDWIGQLDPTVLGVGLALGVGVAAVLLLSGTVLVAIPKIAAFKAALDTLKLSMKGVSLAAGVAGLAIGAAITILALFAASNGEASSRVDALTDSLDQNTGAYTKNTRALVAQNLQADTSLIEFAKKYKVSLSDLTDAALGVPGALGKVQKAWQDARDSGIGEGSNEGFNFLGNGIAYAAGEAEKAKEQWKTQKDLLGDSGESAEKAADGYDTLTDKVDGVVSSITDLAKELDALNGKHLDQRAAARALEQAYDDFDAALQKNGKTLDITTEKGRDNQAALDDIAKSAMDSGQAIIDAGGGYDQYKASLESSRDSLLTRINDLGVTGQAAQDLLDTILHIPSESEWKMYTDTANAEASLKRVQDLIKGIGATGQIHISNGYSGGLTKADGGKVNFYANGGTERHVAQFAKAGTMRVWAEPETGGEWYIPASPAKRERSTQVLAAAANEFGYALVPTGAQSFADGGRSGAASSAAGLTIINHIYPSPGMDEDALADKAAKKMAKALK